MRQWLMLFLTCFSVNTFAYQPSLEIFEDFDNVRLVAFIEEGDIQNYPLWGPLSSEPPLSISKAIQSVVKYHDTRKETGYTNSIDKIELRQLTAHHKNYWHYLVKVKKVSTDKTLYQMYVVLMTGKVIPAMVEPESIK